jgi:hypothetical protein
MTDSITVEELDELDLRYAQAGRLDIGKPNLWPRVSRAARRGLTAWRPIETAPKDGSEILISGGTWYYTESTISDHVSFHGVQIARWIEHRQSWHGGYGSEYDGVYYHSPTHWMPLPPPPTTDPSGEDGK